MGRPMAHDEPYMQFDKLKLRNYLPSEIARLSVMKVVQTRSFDLVGQPVAGGFYDERMGPAESRDRCGTCNQLEIYCPGHMGHIELCVPVFNPVLYGFTLKLMKGTCIQCHRLSIGSDSLAALLFIARMRCLELGVPESIGDIESSLKEHGEIRTKLNEIPHSSEEYVPFVALIDQEISKITKKTVAQLKKTSSFVKPHKVLVDLKNEYTKEFTKQLYHRDKVCKLCKQKNGSLVNDNHRCMIIDFSSSAKAKKTVVKSKKGVDEDEEFDMEMIEEEKKEIEREKLGNTTTFLGKTSGAHSLVAQLEAVNNGTCDKLVWRGAEVREHFRLLWKNEGDLLKIAFPMFDDESEGCPLDGLFCESVLVPPCKYRPIRLFKGERYENPQTVNLRRLLEADEIVRIITLLMSGKGEEKRAVLEFQLMKANLRANMSMNSKMHFAYLTLQSRMNLIFDQESDKTSKETVPGIKQILEKKQGLFRMNMMGKRVNFACRSVITPDPYLDIDEIGIPEVFAKKLTFSEPANQYNLEQIRQLVKKGPEHYPGANFVMLGNGAKKNLPADKPDERLALAKQINVADASRMRPPMQVLRHVKKGDMFVMNRQPSLHKPSMMGHRARILTGQRALRMNYAPCKAYNADFDGDEMNGHLVQSYLAQCEVGEIANVGNNYLVPKDASPLLGLIQDHVVSGVLLTIRGRMLEKEDFMHLVLAAFAETPKRLKIPPPCMLFPKRLWSGKQVITAIMLNNIPEDSPKLNLDGKAKTPIKCWKVRGYPTPDKDHPELTESEVVFREGELMCGVLDKEHYGATNYGLVHCCFELYGHRVGVQILSCFSRLFTTYLQFHGFTLGVGDILCLPEADAARRKAIRESRKIGNQVVITTFGLEENAPESEIKKVLAATYCNPKGIGADVAALDRGMKQAIRPFNDRINAACVPDGLFRLFPQNGLQMMIESGAKGSSVNAMQISCALGQIELEGKRMATTIAGRTLPSFRAFDPSPRAGGYIDQRFLTGINPQELFFHTMAGREGLIDTAVKTSRSGYLQRCIIKHLEGIKVHYDATCRDHDGSVIQFRYGEDGMDVCASSFMESPKQYNFLRQNLPAVEKVVKPTSRELSDRKMGVEEAEKHYEKVKEYRKKLKSSSRWYQAKTSGFLVFSEEYNGLSNKAVRELWNELSDKEKSRYAKGRVKHVDAVDEKFNPYRTLGALPEKMLDNIDGYCTKMEKNAQKIEEERANVKNAPPLFKHEREWLQTDKMRRALYWKGLRSMVAPGENVGLLAAQSIGEPSTQMTLNTFHFAGRGEMNVTLGIPRLREILMTAGKNIATPMAQVKVSPSATTEDIDKIKRQLDRVYLKQVIKNFTLNENINLEKGNCWRRYTLRIELLAKGKREKEAQHLDNRKILEAIEIASSSGEKKKRGEDDEGESTVQSKGFIQTLDRMILKKMDEIEKQVVMHNKRVLGGNHQLGLGVEDQPKKRGGIAAEGDSSDEEAEGGADADASENRLNKRHRDDGEYEGEEEDRGQVEREDDDEEEEDDDIGSVKDMDEDEDREVEQKKKGDTSVKEEEERIRNVCAISGRIHGYSFDTKGNRWCEVVFSVPLRNKSKVDLGTLADRVVDTFIVHQTPGIEKCIYDSETNVLSTQGVNREALINFRDVLDLNTFYSNDLNYMLLRYGVESCRTGIVHEMSSVFEVYGIRPSKRHLTLTADYMTFTGQIEPFNRGAMASSSSPLQQMTFETTIAFMKEALINGQTDSLSSPSARIVVGSMNRGGTGAFDLFLNPSYLS